MKTREKLDEYAEMQGWNKNKRIGWSEAADFGEWLITLFREQSNLDKQFSEIMIKNLINDDTTKQWSTYNAIKIELKNYDYIYNLEIKYRITNGENAKKVILSVIDRIKNKSKELIRLENKIKTFNF